MESVKEVIQDSGSYQSLGLPLIDTLSNSDDIKLIKVYGKLVPLGLTSPYRYKAKYNPKTRTFRFIYFSRGSDGGPYEPKSPTYQIMGSNFNPPLDYKGTDLKTKGWAHCNEFSIKREIVKFYRLRGPHGHGYNPDDPDPNKFYSYLLKGDDKSRVITRSPLLSGYLKSNDCYRAKKFKDVFNRNLCPICGDRLRRRNSGRLRKYHETKCEPLVNVHKQKIRNRRKTIVNDRMGTVPVRSDSFLYHLKNQKIRKKGSSRKDQMTYFWTKKELNEQGSWGEHERLIKKGIDLHNDFDFHKCLGCLKENRGCFPGVVGCAFYIPENGLKCDSCGGKIERFKRSVEEDNYHGGKIGAWELHCTKCGLIPDIKSLVSK